MEQFAEDAELIGTLRDKLWNEAEIHAQVVEGKETEGEKFSDYFDHREPVRAMPSHRALAVLRGRNEGVLNIALKYQPDDTPIIPAKRITSKSSTRRFQGFRRPQMDCATPCA